jgi:SAM-dependent methyltransferase
VHDPCYASPDQGGNGGPRRDPGRHPGSVIRPATGQDALVSSTEQRLGLTAVARLTLDSTQSSTASRRWWDADAEDYQLEHGGFLGDEDFVWCPERVREQDARLLGDAAALAGARVLEVGCGAASCSRWLARQGAHPVGLDLSAGMLGQAALAGARTGVTVPLVQAGAERLPFADGVFDLACSAFGGVPFVADPAGVMREVHRVLRPGGRWVFSVNHPMRWMFSDDPGTAGLTASQSYFDRSPYVEVDDRGMPGYVEHHRTIGDRVRDIVAAGLELLDLVEPEWPEELTETWGQWSPLRGALFPGTAIFICRKPITRTS